MAYINKEKTAEIRNNIKKAFPASKGFKFSIRNEHFSAIAIDIMESPFTFEKDYQQVNHFYAKDHYKDQPEVAKFMTKITEIAMEGNFDKSDSMTDYFHVGWYLHLSIGKWDRPHKTSNK